MPKTETSLRIRATHLQLLERLSNACAVTGAEGEVRAIVLEQLRPVADEVKVDALGDVLVTKFGTATDQKRLRVMVAAHMDEVGFMITAEDGDGFYRFATVGGVDVRHLAGKPVLVGKDHLVGVIGAKPIHLTEHGETEQTLPLDSLRIDLGPEGKNAKMGDRATFATRFTRLGPSLRGKALDNRLGVATLIELVKTCPANIDLLAVFTVQEEIGARGARVAAYAYNPDLAIALDSTPANDLPNWDQAENHVYNTRLGLGPAIYVADSGTLSDPRLVRFLVETAEQNGIPYQVRQPGGGGTDAGAIHRQRAGIPTVSVSVPHRYTHSPVSISRLSDWENTLKLVHTALQSISPAILEADR